MAVLTSAIKANSKAFAANRAAMEAAIAEMTAVQESAGGGAAALERHLSRGKLAPRERIARLLDPGSDFL